MKRRSSCIQQNLPRLSKGSPLPLKRAKPARPVKVGGEVAPFPLRHPFRFHARGFPHVSALRSLPPTPPVSHLQPRPGQRAEKTQGLPAGVDGKAGPRRRRCRLGGRGGGALPPNGPRREAPNLYPLPLAHTNPGVAVGASRRHVHLGPAHPASGPSGSSPAPAARGILGAVVLPGP